MQHWDYLQSDHASSAPGAAYEQTLTQWHRRRSQQAPLHAAYPSVHLTDYSNSGIIHNQNLDTTIARDAVPRSTASITGPRNPTPTPILVQNPNNAVSSAPAFIPSTYNHERTGQIQDAATFPENHGGFFCFSVSTGTRPHGLRACTHCRRTKLKCVFDSDVDSCRRCRADGQQCVVAFRKPKDSGRTRHYLEAQIRQKDQIIESLLEQLQNRPISPPLSISSYRMATSSYDTMNQINRSGRPRSVQPVAGGIYTDFASAISSLKSTNPYLSIALQESLDTGNRNGDEEGEGAEVGNGNSSVTFGQGHGDVGEREADDNIGVANAAYFAPRASNNLGMRAHLIEQHCLPEILIHGIVAREDVDKLFEIFYVNINVRLVSGLHSLCSFCAMQPFLSLLDPVLHTPASTFRRCPFLFTVVCAVSSRYYSEKSGIYPIAMHFAKRSAAKVLNEGRKSVELCQAYILLSVYAVPTRKWEEDCSWLYTGLAIRLATDLNLHQAPIDVAINSNETEQRELLNRTRVWMICFNLDRSAATQSGKPPTIKPDSRMKRRSDDWYQMSPYNSVYDMHLCAFTGLLLIVADFHHDVFFDPSTPFGRNKYVDVRSVALAHSARLAVLSHKWTNRFAQASASKDLAFAFQSELFAFLTAYWRLAMFSFCFEQTYRNGFQSTDDIFFIECLESAKTVLRSMIDGLVPSAFMRYCPDDLFNFAAFASAFLLKLLLPEFSAFMPKQEESEVYDLIERVIGTLSSPRIAVDDRHTSKLCARFLARILSHHHRNKTAHHHTSYMLPNIIRSASMQYGDQWHARPVFTMSSPLGALDEHRNVYYPGQHDIIPTHRPIAIYESRSI
ncbi:hypothetical protein MSAN_00512400 [Mycena sanguinolenta]|uniref:Zn(2)-C6 fungal-type domain-containing protein n=1 Tax=Mycena sanguinolenta TaxID=230812 RepID=A0A8H6Z8P3_9AGAR|nr:hypothetical protein MSAN_00512400 [Mycena sanguinolenta]